MLQLLDPSSLFWAILRLYVGTLICLIPLSICLLYSLLRLVKCNDASEASILCSLAGCAFYGIVVSSLWKDETTLTTESSSLMMKSPPIVLPAYKMDNLPRQLQDLLLLRGGSGGDEAVTKQQQCTTTTTTTSQWLLSSLCCPVCLDEYEPNNDNSNDNDTTTSTMISYGQRCYHIFHADCIRRWTVLHNTTCPCCRQDLVLPQPLQSSYSTKLVVEELPQQQQQHPIDLAVVVASSRQQQQRQSLYHH